MKSLQEFIAEHLDKLNLTTAQKTKKKPVDENFNQDKNVDENIENVMRKLML